MGSSTFTGPIISAGDLLGTVNAPDGNIKAGPSIFFQGAMVPDPRQAMIDRLASVSGHLDSPYFIVMNAIPAASAGTPANVAVAANTVSGTAMTLLATPSAGVTPKVPFYPVGSTTLLASGATFDLGFATLVTTAGSTTATPSNMALFQQGMNILIGNAGAGGVVPFLTKVRSVGATTITLTQAPLASQAAAPVSMTNIQSMLASAQPTAFLPYYMAGQGTPYNPGEVAGRGVGIACSATGGGGVFTVTGYDVYGYAMSEAITHPGGAVTVYGRKAFKHVMTVTPNFTDATRTYSVGTSDVLGFALRSDLFEENEIYAGGAFITTSVGFTPADATVPATSTTGDVRGTVQIGSRGPLGTGVGGASLNGSLRVKLVVNPSLFNQVMSLHGIATSLYGVAQA